MNTNRQWSARRDALAVGLLSVIAAVLCVTFDVSEMLARFTRPLERLQLDEAPMVLLVMAVSLIWFSARRYFEAQRELQLRRTAEISLEDALAENQRLALKYVDMQESEHKALARDLHDELGQYVNAMKLDAVSIRDASSEQSSTVYNSAQAMIINLDRVYGVLRGLIGQLRPVGFDDLGMMAALEHFINDWRARLPAVTIEISTSGELDRLDEAQGLVIYRLVQEALTNMARHSAATRVSISIERPPAGDRINVVIADNGQGADLRAPGTRAPRMRAPGTRAPRSGLGLVGMRERVSALGGELTLVTAPGEGFIVTAMLPLPAATK
jgi:two-component system sensor histidine kinase UhpB